MLKSEKLTATLLIKKHLPHIKFWDCYNDSPDEQRNEVRAAIVTVSEIIRILKINTVGNSKIIVHYKNVLKELKNRLK